MVRSLIYFAAAVDEHNRSFPQEQPITDSEHSTVPTLNSVNLGEGNVQPGYTPGTFRKLETVCLRVCGTLYLS